MKANFLPAALLALGAIAIAACATPRADSRPVAEDPVCVYNGDLGCIRVRVDAATPRASYHGVTYYFCSPRCKDAFESNPEKYLSTAASR